MRSVFSVSAPRFSALRPLNYLAQARVKENGPIRSARLGELNLSIGAGYKHIFTNIDVAPGYGIEVLSQSDMFAAEPEGRHVLKDCLTNPERHLIQKWQILVAGAGTLGENELYGRPIIADGRLAGKYIAYHALDLRFSHPGSDINLFVYAYLLTRHGTWAMRATSYGTKILSLRRDLVSELLVPLPEISVQQRVASLIRHCVEQRETYLRELKAARKVIEDLPEMQEARGMCAERMARRVLWRGLLPTLGAWNFASSGEALQFLSNSWKLRLGDVIQDGGLAYGLRSARIACERPHGYDFASQRDAFLIRPIPRRVLLPGLSREAVFSPPGSLVVAGRGTLGEGELFGRPVLVTGALSRYALTEDLLRLIPRPEHSQTAYAYLSTLVGLRLLRATAVGTKILNLRLDLLRALPFPELDIGRQQAVTNHVDDAAKAKTAAESAEAEAIRIIEEEVLPSWLT